MREVLGIAEDLMPPIQNNGRVIAMANATANRDLGIPSH
jgi:hypothetical protein